MKAVLLSIQPYYVFLIIARIMGWNIPQDKKVDVRKDYPKDDEWNKETYIYCGKNKKSFNRIPKQYQPFMERLLGKVVGEFICNNVEQIIPDYNPILKKFFYGYVVNILPTCLSEEELHKYADTKSLYFWHISDLKIYDKPKELSEFKVPCPTRNQIDGNCTLCKFAQTKSFGMMPKCNAYITRSPQSWQYVEV